MNGSLGNKRASYIRVVGHECREQFLPLDWSACEHLRNLDVVMAGLSELHPPYEQGRAPQYFHLVLFTFAGSARVTLNGHSLRFNPGSCWLVPAGTSIQYALDGPSWDIMWWHLRKGMHWQNLEGNPRRVNLDHPERMKTVMAGLIHERTRGGPDSPVAGRAYTELLGVLIDRLRGKGQSAREQRLRAEISSLWEQVNAKLSYPWTTDSLAETLHVSVGHLHRICREVAEYAPMEMVTRLRMRRARKLLQNSDFPLYCIAPAVGYESPNAFSRAFKRFTGKSPRDFRKHAALFSPGQSS